MNKSFFLFAAGILILAAGCNQPRFTKLKNGLEYKIINGDGSQKIAYGNAIQFRVQQYYNDSLLSTPYDTVVQIMEIDSMKLPVEYVKIFMASNQGDSIVTRISTDTVAKHGQLPPFAKEGQYLGYRFKIVDVITDSSKIPELKNKTMENMRKADSLSIVNQKSIDDKTIKDYLEKNNITAVKTPGGTYVEVQEPGTGAAIDSGTAVSVLYKGTLLNGKVFDQSYDSTGKPTKPFTFVVGQRGAIQGWSDGMVYFKEGGKGRLFIPSASAYGSRGAGADIPPNTPIMFEITIANVLTDKEHETQMAEQQKMRQAQQEMMRQLQQQQQKKGTSQ